MKKLSLIALLALLAMTSYGESTTPNGRGLNDSSIGPFGRGLFRYPQFGHSLYADVHPNFPRMDIPYCTNHPAYDYSGHDAAYRWQTMGLFGLSLPVWTGNIVDSTYALTVNMHLSANLWMDFYDHSTSPIVDTDYRIGAPTITFMHRLKGRFARNYSISWSPFKHESTHLGDELQIRFIDQNRAIRRVNVSYNYTELVLTLNEAENRFAENHCFRFGLMLLWHGGWFNMDPDGGDISLLDPHGMESVPYAQRNPWEIYLQYQYQSPSSKHGFQGIVSAEVRNRECYGFDLTVVNGQQSAVSLQKEKRVFTYNIFVGARYNTPAYDGPFSRIALGVRAYHGNCPFGEFRSVANYSQIGVCMLFE